MHDVLRQHIAGIITLTDEEFAYVSSRFTRQSFKRKEYLFRQGGDVPYFYFVVSGLLMLTHSDGSGKEHVVSFAMEDWWEADLHAFFNREKATMSLQSLEDTEVLCVSVDAFNTLCADVRKFERLFFEKSIRGHIASQQRILSFITSDAKERYEKLMARYPTLLQRVPKTLLASYLGVSRETLSRLSG